MKQYSIYKESGISWLKSVPEEWEIRRLKDKVKFFHGFAYSDEDLSMEDNGKFLLRISELQNEKIVIRSNAKNIQESSAYSKYLIKKGDYLMALSGATSGKIAILDRDEEFYLNQRVAKLIFQKKLNQRFTFFYINRPQVIEIMYLLANVTAQPNFNNDVLNTTFLLPSLPEQKAIADYLDAQTGKLDTKVAKLENKSRLYKEFKLSLINETVTCGLPPEEAQQAGLIPNPPMKDSRIPWIGEIPEHWDVGSVSELTDPVSIKNQPDKELLSVYRDYGVIIKSSRDDNHNRAGSNLSNYKLVRPSWLVLNKMKTWQGSLGVSEYEGLVSPAYIICRTDKKKVAPKYLHFLLRSKRYIGQYNRLSYGVRNDQWDMRYNDFKYLPVTLPPIKEQQEIASFIEMKLGKIDNILLSIDQQITTLKELRKALINDVVTGQICVTHTP